MDAPAGEELYFFIEFEYPAEYLEVITFGGEGSLYLEGEGNLYGGSSEGPALRGRS